MLSFDFPAIVSVFVFIFSLCFINLESKIKTATSASYTDAKAAGNSNFLLNFVENIP